MINIKDILKSWATGINPSKEERNRANERLSVCLSCDFKKELVKNKEWTLYCNVCGCPIQGKVYSSVINPCPKSKWNKVDEKYLDVPISKDKNTLL